MTGRPGAEINIQSGAVDGTKQQTSRQRRIVRMTGRPGAEKWSSGGEDSEKVEINVIECYVMEQMKNWVGGHIEQDDGKTMKEGKDSGGKGRGKVFVQNGTELDWVGV